MFTFSARPVTRRVGRVVVAALALAVVMPVANVVATSSRAHALDPIPRDFDTWHETAVATPGGRPEIVTSDTDGFIWYADGLNNQLVRVDPVSGDQLPFSLGTVHRGVMDLVMGPDGDVWFGDTSNSAIGRLDPRTGIVDSFPLGAPFDWAYSLAVGSDGNIWFGEPSAGGLGAIAPDGTITRVPDPDGAIITDVVSAPDGRLWYTRAGFTSLGVFDPHTRTFDTVPLGLVDVSGLALAHNGTLWATGTGALANVTQSGSITIVPLPPASYGAVVPENVIAGDFMQVYFTEVSGSIGRVDLDGTVSFVRPPFARAQPGHLAVSSIGSLWYVDIARGVLGSV